VWLYTAGAAIAAGVIMTLVMNRPRPVEVVIVSPPPTEPTPAPSLLAYQRAAARSAEALDDLLDRQAVRSAERGPPVQSAVDFLASRGPRE
jgi:hypothetical protein